MAVPDTAELGKVWALMGLVGFGLLHGVRSREYFFERLPT